MPNAEIDSLDIKITADSSKAVKGISNLKKSLQTLKEVSDKALGFDDKGISKIKDLVDGLKNLESIGKVKISDKLPDKIVNLGAAVDALKDVDFSKVEEMANAFSTLSGVGNIKVPQVQMPSAPNEDTGDPSSDLNGSTYVPSSEEIDNATNSLSAMNNTLNSNRSLWTDIASLGSKAFQPIKNAVSSVASAVSSKFDAIKPKIAAVAVAGVIQFNIFKSKAQDCIRQIGDKFNTIKSKVAPVFSYIGNTFSQPVQKIKQLIGTISPHFEKIKNFAVNAFNKITPAVKTVFSKMGSIAGKGAVKVATAIGKTALKPFSKLEAKVKETTGKLGQFFSSIKRIAMYRAIRAMLQAVTQAFKEGTDNAYQYSKAIGGTFAKSMDSISTSMNYFKNSIGAAVIPIINALAPAIDFVIDKCVSLINVLNQVIARLTGASTWTKAVKYPTEYAEAANDASAANKELKKSILGIDELNTLQDNSDSSGGSGSSGTDYSQMFTEEELTGGENPFAGILDVFKNAWESKGQGVIDSIKNAFINIKGLCESIGESFATVWTNGTGQKTLEIILSMVKDIIDMFGNLAGAIKKAWDNNNSGTTILQACWDILNNILQMYENIFKATSDWLSNIDLSPLFSSIAEAVTAFEPLVDLIGNTLSWLYETVLLPIATWTVEEAAPASIDVLTAAFDALNAILTPVIEGIKNLWEHLTPVIEWIESVAMMVINKCKELFEKLGDVFEEKGGKIQEIFQGIGDVVSAVWVVVEPIFNLLRDVVGSVFSFIWDIISGVVGAVIDVFHGLIEFVAGVFTGDWERAWNGIVGIFQGIIDFAKNIWEGMKTFFSNIWNNIKDNALSIWNGIKTGVTNIVTSLKDGIVSAFNTLKSKISDIFTSIKKTIVDIWNGIWNTIKSVINSIIGGIESMANGVIKGLNAMIGAMNKLSFDIPDWVPGLGGKKFGFNIKTINTISIPRLAEGGFVDSGQMFIAREAGAEMVGAIGNQTAVVNNDQIVDSVSQGVAEANMEQNALLREEIGILRKLLEKDTNVTAVVETSSLISGLERKNRRDGRTIVPVGI